MDEAQIQPSASGPGSSTDPFYIYRRTEEVSESLRLRESEREGEDSFHLR